MQTSPRVDGIKTHFEFEFAQHASGAEFATTCDSKGPALGLEPHPHPSTAIERTYDSHHRQGLRQKPHLANLVWAPKLCVFKVH